MHVNTSSAKMLPRQICFDWIHLPLEKLPATCMIEVFNYHVGEQFYGKK